MMGEKEGPLGMRRERGVTLLEIAVVMAIVAIMALFMAPALGEWLDNYRIRQAARDIVSTMQQAKMQAISTRQAHLVEFNVADETYQLTPGGDIVHLPKGVSLDRTDFTDDKVQFNPNGMSTSPDTKAAVYIKNEKGKHYKISVSPSGAINMQEGWS